MRRFAFGLWMGALALGCGGATFVGETHDAGPDASSTGSGSSTTSTGSGSGTTTTTTSSTGGTTGSTTGSATTSGAGGGDAGVDWSQCSGPGQCSAQLLGCCAPCGMPTVDNFAGVNPKYTDVFRAWTCPMPTPCPRCATSINPYIGALCSGTHCKAFDSRNVPEFSKCTTETDCRLRKGLDCCECGSQGPWTAVSIDGLAALNAAVCAPMTGCADCAPIPPAGTKAVCVQGHCEISAGTL
jgi:hypothetical protein